MNYQNSSSMYGKAFKSTICMEMIGQEFESMPKDFCF